MLTPTTATFPSRREPSLDGLRGVAVMLVFLFHYGGGLTSHNPLLHIFGEITAAGWTGVQLFFVLSGFLITGILWRNQSEGQAHFLRNFYVRRALRIVPLVYLVISISLLFCLALGNSGNIFPRFLPEYLFLQDMPRVMHDAEVAQKLPLFHLWTISIEEQYYLLWPLLLLAVRRRLLAAKALCITILVGSILYNAVFVFYPGSIADEVQQRSFFTYCGALALGSLLALFLSSTENSPSPQRANFFASSALVLGLAGFVVAGVLHHSFLLTGSQYFFALPCTWLLAGGLLVHLLRPHSEASWLRSAFSNAFLRFVGRYSYGVYILHIFLEPLFDHIGYAVAHQFYGYPYLATRLLLGFPITLMLAWMSYQLLEFPFLKLKRYFPLASAPTQNL